MDSYFNQTFHTPALGAKQVTLGLWVVAVTFLLFPATLVFAGGQQVDDEQPETVRQYRKPVVIEFDGVIDWNNSTYLHTRIQRAQRHGADLLIIKINSPGGLVSESIRIAETLRDINWAYTVAYIPGQAVSGGALISFGCDEIIVGSNASFGDIGAIEFDPELFAFRYVPAKAQSILVSQARSLAESKGRPPELAESMIDKDVLLFVNSEIQPVQFRTARLQSPTQTPQQAAEQAGIDLANWELVPESGAERFLTLTGTRSVELGLASAKLDNVGEVLKRLNANESMITTFRYNTTDTIVYVLNHPLVTALLVIVGIIALYIEFSAPGLGGGGLIALLCAAIFFWSRFMGGTAGALEIILFVSGIGFLLMEIFVIPGWGISGIMGLGLILVSAVMASLNFVVPESSTQWSQLIANVLILLCSGVASLICLTWLAKKMGSIPVLNRMILVPHTEGGSSPSVVKGKLAGKPTPVPHPVVSVGDWGIAQSVLRPAGRARFGRDSLDVVSEGSYIDPGQQVRVIEITGNRIVVTVIDDLHDTHANQPVSDD